MKIGFFLNIIIMQLKNKSIEELIKKLCLNIHNLVL